MAKDHVLQMLEDVNCRAGYQRSITVPDLKEFNGLFEAEGSRGAW